MSLAAQLAELTNRKQQLVEDALVEIQTLVGALNEAGFSYRLVSQDCEVFSSTAPNSKLRVQRRTQRDVTTPWPKAATRGISLAGTGENVQGPTSQIDPAAALNERMASLSDDDLWNVLNDFYPRFHNLISSVATLTGMSIGHVQRVLVGDRRSATVEAAIVHEFRRRIQQKDDPEVYINENVGLQPGPEQHVKIEIGGKPEATSVADAPVDFIE